MNDSAMLLLHNLRSCHMFIIGDQANYNFHYPRSYTLRPTHQIPQNQPG